MSHLLFFAAANPVLRTLAGISLPFWNPRGVPSGHGQVVEDRYFNYLWHWYFAGGGNQQVNIQWNDEFLVVVWILIIAVLTYLLTNGSYYHQNRRGAATDANGPERQDLYPVEAYNGIITERNGGVDYFNWTLYAMGIAWMLGMLFFQILNGQVY